MTNDLRSRILYAIDAMEKKPTPVEIAAAVGIKPPSVHAWLSGRTRSLGKSLLPLARYFRVNPDWLATGRGPVRPDSDATPPYYSIREADQPAWPYAAPHEIEVVDARGSCGGGSIMWETETLPPLVKEAEWFTRYKVKPSDVFAVFADGDSMSEYIVDGDLVIFDRTKTEATSGAIYLIDHPDGLKIKRLRKGIDARWHLESLNADKSRYPDETLTPDQTDLLRIRGKFVYRQGG